MPFDGVQIDRACEIAEVFPFASKRIRKQKPVARPGTEPSKAVAVLDYVAEKYRAGEWRWIQEAMKDGDGYCLVGALRATAGTRGGIPATVYYLARAARKRMKDRKGFDDIEMIMEFNDCRTRKEVMSLIAAARRLAEADAELAARTENALR